MSEPKIITDTLAQLEAAELHPTRQLARKLVAEHRQGSAIDTRYDFNQAPRELKQVVYDTIVRFSRRRWWSRLLR